MQKLLYVIFAAFIGLALQSEAHAQAQANLFFVSDGFEGSPIGAWNIAGTAGIDINKGYALQGYNNGWVRSASGWNALTRKAAFGTVPSGRKGVQCAISTYVRSSGNVSNFYLTAARADGSVVSEVGPLSGSQVSGSGYTYLIHVFNLPSYMSSALPLYGRVGFWGNGADAWVQVDPITMYCFENTPGVP